jgi:Family of unknown function (DUF6308)
VGKVGKKPKLDKYLDPDRAVPLVYTYFNGALRKDGSVFSFSGAYFERLGGGGNRAETVNRITAEDLVAVSLLGIEVPPHAAIRLLGTDSRRISRLLEQLPRAQKLADVSLDDLYDPTRPAMQLWDLLGSDKGMGPTKVSKLMARKRPHLIPVHDRAVRRALRRDDQWRAVHEIVTTQSERLNEIRVAAGLTTRISLLRVLDVAIWMREEGVEQLPTGAELQRP